MFQAQLSPQRGARGAQFKWGAKSNSATAHVFDVVILEGIFLLSEGRAWGVNPNGCLDSGHMFGQTCVLNFWCKARPQGSVWAEEPNLIIDETYDHENHDEMMVIRPPSTTNLRTPDTAQISTG